MTTSRAKRRISATPRGTGAAPLTVSDARFLIEGSDTQFRRLIYGMHALSMCLDRLRNRIGGLVDLSGGQYQILMVVAELQREQPTNINGVVDTLHMSAPYVTKEIGELVKRGLVKKVGNPRDRREVLVRVTDRGRDALHEVAPHLRQINADFFRGVTAKEFRLLCRLTEKLTRNTGMTLATADEIANRAGKSLRSRPRHVA